MRWPHWLPPATRMRLGMAVAAALVLPWAVGQWARIGLQPGLADDVERRVRLIDYMVAGGMLFGLSMALTYAVGCWVVAVMQGPVRRGDPFPAQRDASHDPR